MALDGGIPVFDKLQDGRQDLVFLHCALVLNAVVKLELRHREVDHDQQPVVLLEVDLHFL